MDYEYKCVGAPERPKRSRRAKTPSDRVAKAMEEIIQKAAGSGWEYLRTDLVPVVEKSTFLGRPQEVHRAVMVFRRRLESAGTRPAERSRRQETASELFSEPAADRRPPRRRQTIVEEPPEPEPAPEPVQAQKPAPRMAAPPRQEPAPAMRQETAPPPEPVTAPAPRTAATPAPEPAAPPPPRPAAAPAPAAAPQPQPAPAPAAAPAPEPVPDRPRRPRAVPADEPFFQALEKVTGPPRGGKGRDRSPPSGLG